MNRSTAQRINIPELDAVTGLDAAAVLADPPALASMVDLSAFLNTPAPLVIDVALVPSADCTLTGAGWFGYDLALTRMVYLGPVLAGADLTLKATSAVSEPIELVAGIYSHVGVGKGVLSAGTLGVHARVLEVSR